MSSQLYCLLSLFGVISNTLGSLEWNTLHVKYTPFPGSTLGVDGYFPLPTTSAQAWVDGWVKVPTDPDVSYYSIWCMVDDPRLCILYNLNGIVAGLQISLVAADVENKVPYDTGIHPVFKRKTRFQQEIITVTVFMENPDVLPEGGRSSLDEGVATGVWLEVGDKIVEIPRQESEIAKTKYVSESCVPGMGKHYYYDMSEDMKCEDFEPIFLFVNSTLQELHGFGFQSIGKASVHERAWFEQIPPSFVKPTIPNAPQCLVDWARDYGIISLHVYFVEEPWNIPCTG